jgi:hypothetical protein
MKRRALKCSMACGRVGTIRELLRGDRYKRYTAGQTSPAAHCKLENGGVAMKKILNLVTLAGLSLAFLALGAAGAKAQTVYSTRFVGTFTLPFEAQWGALTLPAGDYTLEYGMQESGHRLAFVRGTEKGRPYGMILAGPLDQTSETKNALVCVLEGNKGYVRAVELPVIGESARFALPHGVKVEARILRGKLNHNAKTQLAETRIRIARVSVKLDGK